jgi:hypothetical protein
MVGESGTWVLRAIIIVEFTGTAVFLLGATVGKLGTMVAASETRVDLTGTTVAVIVSRVFAVGCEGVAEM